MTLRFFPYIVICKFPDGTKIEAQLFAQDSEFQRGFIAWETENKVKQRAWVSAEWLTNKEN